MFKRVLLCHDGTTSGRRALRRGAELAILLKAQIHVLAIIPTGGPSASVMAGAVGTPFIADESTAYRQMLNEALAWLQARGVSGEAHLGSGNTFDVILSFTRKLAIDLIVLGHYPQPTGGFWWGGTSRSSLAERANCCVFVAVNSPDDTPPTT